MPLFGYGAFITQAVNFVIVAFIIFLLVRAVNRMIPSRMERGRDRRTWRCCAKSATSCRSGQGSGRRG